MLFCVQLRPTFNIRKIPTAGTWLPNFTNFVIAIYSVSKKKTDRYNSHHITSTIHNINVETSYFT